MKMYNIEMRHSAYVNLYVEAENPEQAEALAWEMVESGRVGDTDGDWTLSDVYELPDELGDQPSREG